MRVALCRGGAGLAARRPPPHPALPLAPPGYPCLVKYGAGDQTGLIR